MQPSFNGTDSQPPASSDPAPVDAREFASPASKRKPTARRRNRYAHYRKQNESAPPTSVPHDARARDARELGGLVGRQRAQTAPELGGARSRPDAEALPRATAQLQGGDQGAVLGWREHGIPTRYWESIGADERDGGKAGRGAQTADRGLGERRYPAEAWGRAE